MKIIAVTFLIFLASCSSWNYSNTSHWGDLKEEYKFCKIGANQSPIDIKLPFKDNDLKFSYSASEVELGRLNQITKFVFEKRDKMIIRKKNYYLRSIVFHHPSEHQINGEQQIMEMQVAHKSEDEQWATLAIFVKVGKENTEFNKLISLLEAKKNNAVADFNLTKVIKQNDQVFFYEGSLTTPPCTEGMKWYVMKNPIEMSKEQINKIIKLALSGKANARPLQVFNVNEY